MNMRFFSVLFLFWFVWIPMTVAGGSADKAPVERLQSLLAPLETLAADFTQTVTDGEGYEIQSLSGHMVVARPGRVRWRSETPYEQLVVSNAETLWLYDPDLEQVTVRPFEADVSRTPAILFIGDVADLRERYRVSRHVEGELETFRLAPRDSGALFEEVHLHFDDGRPEAMTLRDSMGQETRVEFSNLVINRPVADTDFTFEIPDGADVLRDD